MTLALLARLGVPALLACAASPALAAVPGEVWTVGPAGADFTQIQPAVDAAADGDLILVKPGNYTQFAIVDRGLTIVAETPGSVHIGGTLRVTALAADKRVNLIHLSGTANEERALRFSGNQGAIRVRGGTWIGKTHASPTLALDAAYVDDCDDVSLRECTLQGGSGLYLNTPVWGGAGLRQRQSNVALHDCALLGGKGATGKSDVNGGDGGSGGAGALVEGGFLFASGCTLTGGQGGNGGDASSLFQDGGNAGSGGDGVQVEDAQLGLLASSLAGGAQGFPGWGPMGFGSSGVPGMPLEVQGDVQLTNHPGPVVRWNGDGHWQAGSAETWSFQGPPGASIWIVASNKTQFLPSASKQGVLLVGGFPSLQFAGTLDASGNLTRVFVPPALPPGHDGLALQRQAWVVPPGGSAALLTQPLSVAWLAPGL